MRRRKARPQPLPQPVEPVVVEQPSELTLEMNRTWGPFGIEVRLVFRPLLGDSWI